MSLRTLLRNSAPLGLLLAIDCALFLSSRGWYLPSFILSTSGEGFTLSPFGQSGLEERPLFIRDSALSLPLSSGTLAPVCRVFALTVLDCHAN
jgi:hypothetical protein